MKKAIMTLLCILLVSICASVAFASDDVGSAATNDTIYDNPDVFISVDLGKDFDFNCSEIVDAADADQNDVDLECNDTADVKDAVGPVVQINENVTADECSSLKDNSSNGSAVIDSNSNISDSHHGPKLVIKGPKASKLKPDGPHFHQLFNDLHNIDDWKLSKYEKYVYHYANILIQHPEWNILKAMRFICDDLFNKVYCGDDVVCSIITDAHNIAFLNYNGNDMVDKNLYNPYTIYTYMLYYGSWKR